MAQEKTRRPSVNAQEGASATLLGDPEGVVDVDVDVEEALDLIGSPGCWFPGGLGWYQLRHFTLCGAFWFWQASVLISVFMNGAWCTSELEESSCLAAQDQGCSWDAAEDVCRVNAEDVGGGRPGDDFWGACRTLSCQFDLVPGTPRGNFRNLFDSMFFAGWLWSVPIVGAISDKYGRKKALLGACVVLNVGQLGCAFAPNEWVYIVFRHITGAGTGCCSLTSFVLGIEYCPKSKGGAVKAGWSFWSGLGYVCTSLYARQLSLAPGYNWRVMNLVTMAPLLLVCCSLPFLLDESARWMLVNKGVREASEQLDRVARINGAPTGQYRLRAVVEAEGKAATKDRTMDLLSATMRTRTLCTMLLWFSAAFSYYGLTLRASALPGDTYQITALMSAVELPTYVLLVPLLNSRLGRRGTTGACFLLLGAASYTVLGWTTTTGQLVLNLVGKMLSSACFACVYLWAAELFPTSVKQTGMSLCSLSARAGSIVAPWTTDIGEALPIPEAFARDVPLLIFGSVAIIAILVSISFLAETRNKVSPETIADVAAAAAATSLFCC